LHQNKLTILMRILRFSIVIYFILILNSCFSGIKKNIDNLKNCEINIVNLIVSTEPKQNFSFVPKILIIPIVSVKNPNEEDVEIYEFNLDLALVTKDGDQPIGVVINEEKKVIPKFETLEFPLILDMDQKNGIDAKLISILLQLFAAAMRGESAEVFIKGDVLVGSSLGSISVPISERKKVKLQK